MGKYKSLTGTYDIQIISASLSDVLSKISDSGIIIRNAEFIDPLKINMTVYRHQYNKLRSVVLRYGGDVKILKKTGLFWTIISLKNRKFLILGMIIIVFLAIFLQTRILFIRVEGNCKIPSKKILESAEMCGIHFGASRRLVRSEKIKNTLLEVTPQLQWAGINTYGCVAVISVKERTTTDEAEEKTGVASVISVTDGVISEITVTRGNPLCKVGQAVQKGQVLVSGYTDCGLSIKAEAAQAEVYANTNREITAISPKNFSIRDAVTETKRRYSILFGKKLIKFYKDSGISGATCVKMYRENYLKLPGGFVLPVALVTEEYTYQSLLHRSFDSEDCFDWLKEYSDRYLNEQMLSGKIIHQTNIGQFLEDSYILTGNYACVEMIGQVQSEEILLND